MRRITSPANTQWRAAVQLAGSARERRKSRETFIEGANLCTSYLHRHGVPRVALLADSALRDPALSALIEAVAGVAWSLPDSLFRQISQQASGAPIAFVIATPTPAPPERWQGDLVYLDGLQDPGNVGSILRSCAAAGIDTVVTAPHGAFVWAPKVVRAGMGAHFALDVFEGLDWSALRAHLPADVEIRATRLGDAQPLFAADLRRPGCWVFGNEGRGVSMPEADARWLSIPQTERVESLNVAAAAAVCLFEQRRQRIAPQGR